jgi:transposase
MALRGHLAELGIVAPKGIANTPQLIALMQSAGGIPELVREVAEILHQQLLDLDAWIQVLESRIMKWHRSREMSRRLAEVPSIGQL